jgi:hypothetical protein
MSNDNEQKQRTICTFSGTPSEVLMTVKVDRFSERRPCNDGTCDNKACIAWDNAYHL